MATLDWQLRRTDEVTLVELSVHSDREQRVRIESRLTPVWPPRRQGVPARGWQDDTFEGTVDGDRPLVVGYATPAPPAEPPAEITETGHAAEDEAVTPHTLVRTLGDARPPRDALGSRRSAAEEPSPVDVDRTTGGSAGAPTADTQMTGLGDAPAADTRVTEPGGNLTSAVQSPQGAYQQTAEKPTAVTEWLNSVESRLATTRRLADATDADEIRDTVDEVGGIEAVRSLQAQLDADRRQLQEIRRRSETLTERLSAVELPLATLERVV